MKGLDKLTPAELVRTRSRIVGLLTDEQKTEFALLFAAHEPPSVWPIVGTAERVEFTFAPSIEGAKEEGAR